MQLRRFLLALVISCGGTDPGDGPGTELCSGIACAPGTYCSAALACVADGGCLVDDDCGASATETHCSIGQTCIAPGTCAVDGDCDAGSRCNSATHACEPGGCGGEILDLTYVPPNFLIVLDRSCSMTKVLTGTQQTKWGAAVGALHEVLASYPDDIRWGLTLFPDTSNQTCGQDAIPFPVADHQATAIDTLLQGALSSSDPLFPDGPCVTNIDTAIQQAATDPGLADPARKSFVMLVSDGAQSAGCDLGGSDAGTEQAIAELAAAGVTTFVVGFGSATDAAALDAFAIAGGAPLAGATKYYQADTANQLDQVFQSIAGLVVSCDYLVDPAPPDLGLTYVFFHDTEQVPRDTAHVDGWDYDPATMKLTLYGTACARVQDHSETDVDVVFGCPAPPLD